jgi:hypothetical protein
MADEAGRVGDEHDLASLTTALRVFTTRRPTGKKKTSGARAEQGPRAARVKRRYPHEALVFDTETYPGPAQELRILVWRLYRDRADGRPGSTCIEEGIAYPDAMAESAPAGYRVLVEYARAHHAHVAPGFGTALRCEPLSWWLEQRLLRYGYAHADRCAVVAFNALFDLGRVARYWAPGRGTYRGGYSLGLWGRFLRDGRWKDRKYRPRLQLRAIDPRRTLFRWTPTVRKDPDWRGPGRFVDLRTLTFALTDRSHTLETACAAFGDPYAKAEVEYAELTPELIDYARADVEHTALLYRNCLGELARHEGVELEAHRLYSPASVGTSYLEALGLTRPLVKFTGLSGVELGWEMEGDEPRGDLDQRLLGWAMSAFYGGRAEARIVRQEVPVALVDCTSMYPTVNALLGTWRFLCAERLSVTESTKEVRELLDNPELLDRCLTPALWREVGVTFVELEPEGDVLPCRAGYDPGSPDYGIGINRLRYQGRLWCALPDVIAAALLNPRDGKPTPPRIVRSLRLVPTGEQPGLRSIRLRGGELIDPSRDDPFVAMINARQRVLQDEALAEEERKRLERFLKITANATSYGVLARFDRRPRGKPIPVTVFGPDDEPRPDSVPAVEDPGPFSFPPVAASITAGARLLLALLERLVRDADGSYAFCDTDSMAIVASPRARRIPCPTGTGNNFVGALSWARVRRILRRFDDLNPYDRSLVPELWKVEQESMTEPVSCYAISAKRYCVFRRDPSGRAEIVGASDSLDEQGDDSASDTAEALADWSEHGLGLYLDPTSADPDRPRRDSKGRRLWVREAWEWILARADGGTPPLPSWAGRFALTRFTVSGPAIEAWFAGYNRARAREHWIRPGSFGLLGHPIAFAAGGALPAAPYETKPERWAALDWYDRRSGQPLRVTALAGDHDPEERAHALSRGDIPIQLLTDVLTSYPTRIEHKSLAPDGTVVGEATAGLLRRRSVTSDPEHTELTGKEGNQLAERATGEVTDPGEYRTSYGHRGDRWYAHVLPVLRDMGARLVAERTGFGLRGVHKVLRGNTRPHPKRRATYEAVAVAFAAEQLGEPTVSDGTDVLRRYLEVRGRGGEETRFCEYCGEPIPPERRSDARYDSDRCRKAANRARRKVAG